MRTNEVLDDEDLADGIRLACQSLPVSDTVIIGRLGRYRMAIIMPTIIPALNTACSQPHAAAP